MEEQNKPWIIKYKPKKTSEIFGNKDKIAELRGFIANFNSFTKKAAIVYGPSGVGKTSAVYAIANELDYEVVELNASNFRNKEQIDRIIGNAMMQKSLFNKGKILLVDELEGLSGTKDRGGISALASILGKKRNFPVIITAVNPYENKFSSLRSKSLLIGFESPGYIDVFNCLKKIADNEGISYDVPALKSLARQSGGDFRAAINDLQSLVFVSKEKGKITLNDLNSLGHREQSSTIISALTRIFKTKDAKIALGALDNISEDFDQVMLWIDKNLPEEYKKPKDLAMAYNYLSLADVFKRRIKRRQQWRFMVYINAFLTAGIAVSKDKKYDHFIHYKPTMRILKLWQAKMKYQKRKAIAEKIAQKTHCSTKTALSNMPYFSVIFKKNRKAAETIKECLELSNDEAGWLSGG